MHQHGEMAESSDSGKDQLKLSAAAAEDRICETDSCVFIHIYIYMYII